MGKPLAEYDDEQLVLDIACGRLTYAQIAARHGLTESMVGRIARGERRPELQAKIQAAAQGFVDVAMRLGARLATLAMGRLGKLIEKDSDAPAETQRKAAVDLLKFALGDPSRPEVTVSQSSQNNMPGLSAEELELLAGIKGGPDIAAGPRHVAALPGPEDSCD